MMPARSILLLALFALCLLGCGDEQTVIPTGEFTEAEKKAIQAEDASVADLESHGTAKKRKK